MSEKDREARLLAAERVRGGGGALEGWVSAGERRRRPAHTARQLTPAPLLPLCRALFSPQSQAQARQENFQASAVGRAAYTAVKKAKEQDARPQAQDQVARDWLS